MFTGRVYGAKSIDSTATKVLSLWNCGWESEGASVVFKPRGAAVRQFAGKARSVYCSKQLQKLHPCHLYREGACGGICGRTASHTCRVVSSLLVSTPSSWWLEVALMTTVRSGKCSARPRHTLTPLLAPTTQPRLGPPTQRHRRATI
jgi:hypothetical protein